ncbi:hypothetical protein Tco_1258084 [Tanacetum coccineum]
MVDPNGRLIAEDPSPSIPRVATPNGLRPTIIKLHDKINRIETRHRMLERMARRQSYQLDRYVGVFEYMVRQYNATLQGAYTPPGYEEEPQDDEE